MFSCGWWRNRRCPEPAPTLALPQRGREVNSFDRVGKAATGANSFPLWGKAGMGARNDHSWIGIRNIYFMRSSVCYSTMWAMLIITLPTQPNAVRLRIWRNLKALGCAALRDGAYLLPEALAQSFDPIVGEVREHAGTALVLSMTARNDTQQREIEALFDRSEAYAQWCESAGALSAEVASLGETEARRRLRGVSEALSALRRIDYYPGQAAEQADSDLSALRIAIDAQFTKGEPVARPAHGIRQLDAAKFQRKRWATRERPWVDRLACAWLIRRFIDRHAEFLWLSEPANAPRGSIGFDFDGARFTHVGTLVSFEVLMASFGLAGDAGLQRIARIVHYLDVGGIPASEAPGLEAVLAGLRQVHADDDRLVRAASAVFDALHAACAAAKP